METEARRFLDALFAQHVGDSALISVWTMPDKATRFFAATSEAADYAMDRAGDSDVYFGCGLYRPGIAGGRGTAADVAGITSVWADVDFGPGHKKNVPPDKAAAMRVLDSVGVKPSIVVHSGHGLHAYWLLTEALAVADGAASLARRWGLTVQAFARAAGHTLDSVGDLARVLRVPGTRNRKNGDAAVSLHECDGPRYDADELSGWCVEEHFDASNVSALTHVDPLILRPDADPPVDKLTALMENDAKFRRTLAMDRKDLADGTPSSYDFSLACQTASVGWTDQEMANLLIYFRRKRGTKPEKALRRDYLQRTIGNARKTMQSQVAAAQLEHSVSESNLGGDDPERAKIMGLLAKALGLPIERWVKDGREGGSYYLHLSGGRDILIGQAGDVISQREFRKRVYDVIDELPHAMKQEVWDKIVRRLAQVVEVQDNPESGRENRGQEWIESYLDANHVTEDGSDWRDAAIHLRPYVRDGLVYVHSGHLCTYVKFRLNEAPQTRKGLYPYLRALGFCPVPVTIRKDDQTVVGRRYWRGKIRNNVLL